MSPSRNERTKRLISKPEPTASTLVHFVGIDEFQFFALLVRVSFMPTVSSVLVIVPATVGKAVACNAVVQTSGCEFFRIQREATAQQGCKNENRFFIGI